MTPKQLAEEAHALSLKARAILDEAKGKALSVDKQKEFDAIEADMDEKKSLAEKLEKVSKIESWSSETVKSHPLVTGAETTPDPSKKKLKNPEHSKALDAYLRKGANLEPESRKMLSSLSDPDGGYVTTEEMSSELVRKLRDATYIRARSRVVRTSKSQFSMPTFDFSKTISKAKEGQTQASTNITNAFGKTLFNPHKKMEIIPFPRELMEDAVIDVEAFITDFFAILFGEQDERDFMIGTGNTEPLGITVASLNSQDIAGATTVIVYDDIIDAEMGIKQQYRNRAAWLMNRTTVKKVRKLRDNSGGAGTGQYLWQPSLVAGQPNTLNGFPIMESEYFPDPEIGADGDPMVIFGDWNWYWIVDRNTISVQRLEEFFADSDQVGIKITKRTDAAPVLKDAFFRLNRK